MYYIFHQKYLPFRKLIIFCMSLLLYSCGENMVNTCDKRVFLGINMPEKEWINIGCESGVDYLYSKNGFSWIDKSGQPQVIYSDLRFVDELSDWGKLSTKNGKFTDYLSKEMLADYQIKNFNRWLVDEWGPVDNFYENIRFVRFLINENVYIEMYFYYNKGEFPEFVKICLEFCKYIPPVYMQLVPD